jgi:apolipoprotein N-acyltransferase
VEAETVVRKIVSLPVSDLRHIPLAIVAVNLLLRALCCVAGGFVLACVCWCSVPGCDVSVSSWVARNGGQGGSPSVSALGCYMLVVDFVAGTEVRLSATCLRDRLVGCVCECLDSLLC